MTVLAVLLVAACGTGSVGARPHGTVAGVVVSAPSCPVARAGAPCPPRPVPDAAVVALADGRPVAATHTDAHGRFQLDLPSGRYVVVATNAGGYASHVRRVVTVRTAVTTIRLTVDSGIR